MHAGDEMGTRLRPWTDFDVDDQLAFFQRNREAFAPWEPIRPPEFFDTPGQEFVNEHARGEWRAGRGFAYGLELEDATLVGRFALSNVVRGAFLSANIGWMVDAGNWSRGLATAGVQRTLAEAFGTHGLHRIEASIMPSNARSLRVAEKCGFSRIGLSRRHLRINGQWQDHDLYAITVEEWSAQQVT